jgi:hypothetical protein
MDEQFSDRIAPFFTIWFQPRATIRKIVETDPNRYVFALVATNATLAVLERAWAKAMTGAAPLTAAWPFSVAVGVVVAVVIAILGLQINSWLARWSGGILGGTANRFEVRAAVAWSIVPSIAGSAIALIAILLGVVEPPTFTFLGFPALSAGSLEFTGIYAIFTIWSAVLWFKCLGEVHRFSAWRAFVAGFVVWAAIGFVVGIPLGFAIIRMHMR